MIHEFAVKCIQHQKTKKMFHDVKNLTCICHHVFENFVFVLQQMIKNIEKNISESFDIDIEFYIRNQINFHIINLILLLQFIISNA